MPRRVQPRGIAGQGAVVRLVGEDSIAPQTRGRAAAAREVASEESDAPQGAKKAVGAEFGGWAVVMRGVISVCLTFCDGVDSDSSGASSCVVP